MRSPDSYTVIPDPPCPLSRSLPKIRESRPQCSASSWLQVNSRVGTFQSRSFRKVASLLRAIVTADGRLRQLINGASFDPQLITRSFGFCTYLLLTLFINQPSTSSTIARAELDGPYGYRKILVMIMLSLVQEFGLIGSRINFPDVCFKRCKHMPN